MFTRKQVTISAMLAATLAPSVGCSAGPADAGNEAIGNTASALVIPNTLVGYGDPGAVIYFGIRYITYIGTDQHINVMKETAPLSQTYTKQVLGDRSTSGASLAVFNNRLYMAFVGTNNQINVLNTLDGIFWGGRAIFSGSKHGLPGMVVYNNRLWLFVHEYDDRAVAYYSDGTYIGTYDDVRSNDGFVAAALNNSLYLVWSSTDSSQQINVRNYQPALGWSPIYRPSTLNGGNPSITEILAGGGMPSALALIVGCRRSALCFGTLGVTDAFISFDGSTFTYQNINEGLVHTYDKPIAFNGFWNGSTAALNIAWPSDSDHSLNVIER